MNAVEIEEAISQLAEHPFDAATFPYAFLEAFGNKETTIIFVLHLQKTFHCSKIIAQMQIACRANSTNNCFHKKGIH